MADDEKEREHAEGRGGGSEPDRATEQAHASSREREVAPGASGASRPSDPPRRGDGDLDRGDGHPGGDAGAGSAEGSDDGGFPWGKTCLGCGCLALLLAVCGGGLTFAFSGYLLQDLAKSAQERIEVAEEVQEKRRAFVEDRDPEATFESPLSASEFEAFRSTVEGWRTSDPFRQIESLSEEDSVSQNDSYVDQLQAVYRLWQSATAIQKLGTAYLESIENNGGLEAHYERLLRIGALVAATHEVASDRRFDRPGAPVSDEVADLLYEDHETVLEKYGDKIDELRSSEPTFQRLASRGELGIYALAVLPRESYETWHGFSRERREKVFEAFGWSVTAEALTFGNFAFPIDFEQGLPIGG